MTSGALTPENPCTYPMAQQAHSKAVAAAKTMPRIAPRGEK